MIPWAAVAPVGVVSNAAPDATSGLVAALRQPCSALALCEIRTGASVLVEAARPGMQGSDCSTPPVLLPQADPVRGEFTAAV